MGSPNSSPTPIQSRIASSTAGESSSGVSAWVMQPSNSSTRAIFLVLFLPLVAAGIFWAPGFFFYAGLWILVAPFVAIPLADALEEKGEHPYGGPNDTVDGGGSRGGLE
jgi:hypothetical protein